MPHRAAPGPRRARLTTRCGAAFLALSLALARAASAQPAAAPPRATLQGVVYDSLTRRPLGGATVQLVRADNLAAPGWTAATDSAGAFRIDTVPPGRYYVGLLHPVLDLLEIKLPPRVVEVAPGRAAVRVDLATPAPARVWAALCGRAPTPGDSSGLLAGRVRDADTEAPVPGATVVLTWTELTFATGGVRTDRRRVPATTRASGAYLVCGAPSGAGVVASADAPGRASGLVEVDVPVGGLLVRDFALGDTASRGPAADSTAPPLARGRARLTGTVRDPRGRPLRGARVAVWGAAASTETGEAGNFALEALPAGTRTLEVRALGFQPRRLAVDLAAGRAATADVRMAAAVATLDRVVVYGKRARAARQIDEFLDRKRRNPFGRFVTAADIERSSPFAVSEALRMTPGIRVVPAGGYGNTIVGRGNCTPGVFLDGMPIIDGAREIDYLVSPQQVAGIEVYHGGAGAPAQYGGMQANGCGVVLLWTKR